MPRPSRMRLCVVSCWRPPLYLSFFFSNHSAPPDIYTLSYTTLFRSQCTAICASLTLGLPLWSLVICFAGSFRSEEHTSELQSHSDLVCRLLLEKKKTLTHQTIAERDRLNDEEYSKKRHEGRMDWITE